EVGERDHLDGARGLVRHEGQIALLGVPAGRSRWEDKPRLLGYVYTDRPVYRPGDTVHFSAVLRRLADGKLANLPNTNALVVVNDPKGVELLRTELVTNEFGTLHGEYDVGTDDPPLGKYQVYVGVDGRGSSGAFRVEEYKKPEFLVTIELASTDVLPGEEAKATIRVEYYWGQPVPGAQVYYSVKATNYWPTYDFPSLYGWLFSDWGSYEYARWKGYGRAARDFRGEEPWGPVRQASAYTDEKGEAAISFPTYSREKRDYTYTITADVTDQSRHTVSGSANLKVTHQSFYLHPKTVQRLYHASDKVTVDLRALTPNDQPVTTTGTLMLYKLIPSEREVEEQGRKRTERYEEREPALGEPLAFQTDADGNAHVTFIPDREGWFEVEVSAEDPRRDGPTKATTRFWAVNHDFDGQNLDYTNLTLETERDIYEVGETARVLINAPVRNTDALVLIRGRQRQTSQVVRLNGSAAILEVPIVEEFRPSVTVLVALVDEGHVYEQKRVLFVPPSEKLLQVEVNSEKSEYRPGETGRFDVTVRDRQGHPAEAEVCLAVADEAVYYIQDEMAQPIEKAFYARDSRVRPYIVSSWERQHVTERSVSVMYAGARMESPYDPWSAGGMGRAGPAGPKGARGGYEFAMGISRLEIFNQGFAPSEQELVEPTLRKLFADTCFWGPTLRTGADGKASAEVTFPDNLTTWRATARAVTRTTQVGQSKGEARTSKDIIARLQAPRFLVAGDRCTISTLAHNYLDEAKDVQVEFAAEGVQCAATAPRQVRIEPKAEARVDREVVAETPGTALLTAKALTNVESDAMQLPVPVLPHRVERFVYRAGQVADEGGETFELPAERVPGSEALTVRITPSVAASLLDALPFLADYPYGCIEQTMNRFLPSVIVAETVKKLGLDPGGKLEDVPRKVEAGLRRIRQLREERGGWGWWPGATDAHMTAYVVSGLLRAKAAGYPQSSYILQDELKRLREGLRYGHRLDDLAFEVYVLAQAGERPGDAVDRVYAEREKLNDYSRALLALTLHYMHDSREQVVLRNLLDYRVETERGCHWGQQGGWRWSDDKVEATAASLQALLRIDPGSPLIPKTVWWLVTNRQGDHWKSTKDTALAIAALSEYLVRTKELQPGYTAHVYVNGALAQSIEVTPQNALSLDGRITLDPKVLKTGGNTVRIRKDGGGALYYALTASYDSTEEPIKGASTMLSVSRAIYAVEDTIDEDGGPETKRTPISGPVPSGTLLEVELTISSENDIDYVMFEDPKPAGCEPVALTSGYDYSGSLYPYRELRDEKVSFFVNHLKQGENTLVYRLRAEIPGDFHVLPDVGKGMYLTDARCLGDETRLSVR
ncbi:MAG: hypothetical protein FJX75_08695, partial [Armatimonadetes bacterium]|nr:hypothetical protein [Armatimonadota bacterium]